MARGGVAAICVAAVTTLSTVEPIGAILAGQFAFLPTPSGSTGTGPVQGVTRSPVETLAG